MLSWKSWIILFNFSMYKVGISSFLYLFLKLFKARYIHSFVSVFSSFIYILASMSFNFFTPTYSCTMVSIIFLCNIFWAIYVLLICFNRKAFRFIQIKVATTFPNDVHFYIQHKVRSLRIWIVGWYSCFSWN